MKSLKSEAKDLGKLQQSNEKMKAEIELWRKKSSEEAERVAIEINLKNLKNIENQKNENLNISLELKNEKEVSVTLRSLLNEAEEKIKKLEIQINSLHNDVIDAKSVNRANLSISNSNSNSDLHVNIPPPPVVIVSSPTITTKHTHQTTTNPNPTTTGTNHTNTTSTNTKLQCEYDTLLNIHERESALWSVKMIEIEELNTQMYMMSESNTRMDEENTELNDEIARLRSLLLDQGSLGKYVYDMCISVCDIRCISV